ncbi:hypothetical protein [Cyclobacterium salsum]|uniref:hypothetical protein n=1 Tax=Cyclobacterium salsum TaxID=2666329 RepID=UPI001390BE28|nr:hypothetical protein [Cyclobacterium salsum]
MTKSTASEMNNHELKLFLTEDIFVIKDEVREKLAAAQLASRLELEQEASELLEETMEVAQPSGSPDPEPLPYEGEFQKSILIVYQGEELHSGTREFLLKIFRAVNLSLKDIALVSEKSLKESNEDPLAQLSPGKLILFGTIHHPLMKLKKENYRIMQDPLEYFFADELEELEKNVPLKRKLWDTLQVFFNVK